jgi:hypothetical protein
MVGHGVLLPLFLRPLPRYLNTMTERPVDPRRPGEQAGDLKDIEPASKIGRPGFAMAVVAAIVVLAVVLLILAR